MSSFSTFKNIDLRHRILMYIFDPEFLRCTHKNRKQNQLLYFLTLTLLHHFSTESVSVFFYSFPCSKEY